LIIFQWINWLDIFFIIILFSYTIGSMKKGLVHSLFGVFSFWISIFLSGKLYPKVADLIKNKLHLDIFFKQVLTQAIDSSQTLKNYSESIDFNTLELPKNFAPDLLNDLKFPGFIKNNFLTQNNFLDIFDFNSLRDFISNDFSSLLLNISAMLITFVIIFFFLSIISKLLKIITFLPFVNIINKAGGLAIGFIKGIIALWIICIIFSLVIDYPVSKFLRDALSTSNFAIRFYDSNLILKLFSHYLPKLICMI